VYDRNGLDATERTAVIYAVLIHKSDPVTAVRPLLHECKVGKNREQRATASVCGFASDIVRLEHRLDHQNEHEKYNIGTARSRGPEIGRYERVKQGKKGDSRFLFFARVVASHLSSVAPGVGRVAVAVRALCSKCRTPRTMGVP
jgi:hypothetical protein